ncbi:MAG: hypothetical protein HPY50_09865 [Firmicutes bacterium]|nr:hypothetical protein [Bacillota bacterium]
MIPRHKRLKRESRLQAAKYWIPKYTGKNLVRGYHKHFGVNLLCAVNELRMLGYEVPQDYVNKLTINEIGKQKRAEQKKRMKKEHELLNNYPDSDGTFYFIAGHTSGGAPYGITWEEMEIGSYSTMGKTTLPSQLLRAPNIFHQPPSTGR